MKVNGGRELGGTWDEDKNSPGRGESGIKITGEREWKSVVDRRDHLEDVPETWDRGNG